MFVVLCLCGNMCARWLRPGCRCAEQEGNRVPSCCLLCVQNQTDDVALAVATVQGVLYLGGGSDPQGFNSRFYNDMWSFNSSWSWNSTGTAAWTERCVWVAGCSRLPSLPVCPTSVRLSHLPSCRSCFHRAYSSVAVYLDKAYLVGGVNQFTIMADAWTFSSSTMQWTSVRSRGSPKQHSPKR